MPAAIGGGSERDCVISEEAESPILATPMQIRFSEGTFTEEKLKRRNRRVKLFWADDTGTHPGK